MKAVCRNSSEEVKILKLLSNVKPYPKVFVLLLWFLQLFLVFKGNALTFNRFIISSSNKSYSYIIQVDTKQVQKVIFLKRKKKQTHVLWKLISTNHNILVCHNPSIQRNHRIHPAKQELIIFMSFGLD